MKAIAEYYHGIWSLKTERYPGMGVKPAGCVEFHLDDEHNHLVADFLFDDEMQLLVMHIGPRALDENPMHVLGGISNLIGVLPLTKLVSAEYARKLVNMHECVLQMGELDYNADFARELVDCW